MTINICKWSVYIGPLTVSNSKKSLIQDLHVSCLATSFNKGLCSRTCFETELGKKQLRNGYFCTAISSQYTINHHALTSHFAWSSKPERGPRERHRYLSISNKQIKLFWRRAQSILEARFRLKGKFVSLSSFVMMKPWRI